MKPFHTPFKGPHFTFHGPFHMFFTLHCVMNSIFCWLCLLNWFVRVVFPSLATVTNLVSAVDSNCRWGRKKDGRNTTSSKIVTYVVVPSNFLISLSSELNWHQFLTRVLIIWNELERATCSSWTVENLPHHFIVFWILQLWMSEKTDRKVLIA